MLEWDHEMEDLEGGYCAVQFRSKKDYEHMLNDGPWVVMGNYLIVAK